jgi:hypothetical protein
MAGAAAQTPAAYAAAQGAPSRTCAAERQQQDHSVGAAPAAGSLRLVVPRRVNPGDMQLCRMQARGV